MNPPEPLVNALRRLLRPLARLMLAQGVTFPFLAELLKEVLVEVAARDFALDDKRQTDSRLSLLTGVHRKDVRRLREADARPEGGMPRTVSRGAQLVAAWLTRPPFQDAAGQPLPLPRLARDGAKLSFEALVASVSKDIRSRAVLDEWLRLGVVDLDEHDRVRLRTDAFAPAAGFEEKAFYFGQNLHDHLAAAAANLQGADPPWLERSVHYDALAPADIARLEALARQQGMETLKALSRSAAAYEATLSGEAPRHRFTFGIYFYSEPAGPPAGGEQ